MNNVVLGSILLSVAIVLAPIGLSLMIGEYKKPEEVKAIVLPKDGDLVITDLVVHTQDVAEKFIPTCKSCGASSNMYHYGDELRCTHCGKSVTGSK